LEHDATVDAQGGMLSNTALQLACYRGYSDIVRMLLDWGANVRAKAGSHGDAFAAADDCQSPDNGDMIAEMLRVAVAVEPED
jgi:ankyrin repeat protein